LITLLMTCGDCARSVDIGPLSGCQRDTDHCLFTTEADQMVLHIVARASWPPAAVRRHTTMLFLQ
jgi:hypothetical protein